MNLLDDQKIGIPCPECSHETQKSIRWIKTHRQFTCRCGTVVNLKADQFRREIAKVDRAFADFRKTMSKLTIKLKI